jgi:hypothetical protein
MAAIVLIALLVFITIREYIQILGYTYLLRLEKNQQQPLDLMARICSRFITENHNQSTDKNH